MVSLGVRDGKMSKDVNLENVNRGGEVKNLEFAWNRGRFEIFILVLLRVSVI
jgi:hypothetical protein